MPQIINAENVATECCAVFKIDLKGRFVYIDDDTEEFFGVDRDELFGRSIYEYLATDSHRVLDELLNRRKRYESIYEVVSLTVRAEQNAIRRFDTVVSLNFIAGNPVNYQMILIPERTVDLSREKSPERTLLELIDGGYNHLDFSTLTGVFCRAGGFTEGACYLVDKSNKLNSRGSYPHHYDAFTAPAYVQEFFRETVATPAKHNLHANIKRRTGEYAIILSAPDQGHILIHLHCQKEYHLGKARLQTISLLANVWNRSFEAAATEPSVGEDLSQIGRVLDAADIGYFILDQSFNLLYANNAAIRGVEANSSPMKIDCEKIFAAYGLSSGDGSPVTAASSAIGRAKAEKKTNRATYRCSRDGMRQVSMVCCPHTFGGNDALAVMLIPLAAMDDSGPTAIYMQKLIRTLAHDLSAPLITISAFAGRLESTQSETIDNNDRMSISCIMENTKIMREMIDSLDKLARNWDSQHSPEQVKTAGVFSEITQQLRTTYPDYNGAVVVPKNLPELKIEKFKFTQVVRNLLDNAIKYSALSTKPEISINYETIGGSHQFSISDNGPGMDKTYARKIFEPFFRVPDMEHLKIPGSGIGLAIVYDIIKSWNGEIEVSDASPSGTTITFRIPHE